MIEISISDTYDIRWRSSNRMLLYSIPFRITRNWYWWHFVADHVNRSIKHAFDKRNGSQIIWEFNFYFSCAYRLLETKLDRIIFMELSHDRELYDHDLAQEKRGSHVWVMHRVWSLSDQYFNDVMIKSDWRCIPIIFFFWKILSVSNNSVYNITTTLNWSEIWFNISYDLE